MSSVITGLEVLKASKQLQESIKGNVAYLCHSASVDNNFVSGIEILQNIFGKRLIKLFGPQHGIRSDVQDNMIESDHFEHPHYKIPVYSLYSETRIPTDEMLREIDSLIIDLQDVGTRVYTYISTLGLLMEKCADKDITLFVLDRPNPVGGKAIEGNVLDKDFKSFVGQYEIPMRHGLTFGEFAYYVQKYHCPNTKLEVVKLKNWKREMLFDETGLTWVNPSPNLPTSIGSLTYPGTVLYEGTTLSEGRGTTRPLEIIGHPNLNAYQFCSKMNKALDKLGLNSQVIRPIEFLPTFQKHAGVICGGFQIHPTNIVSFRPWHVAQLLMQELYFSDLTDQFWNDSPYEYEFEKLSIDLINGTDLIRKWIEKKGSYQDLLEIESQFRSNYMEKIQDIYIY